MTRGYHYVTDDDVAKMTEARERGASWGECAELVGCGKVAARRHVTERRPDLKGELSKPKEPRPRLTTAKLRELLSGWTVLCRRVGASHDACLYELCRVTRQRGK